MSDQWLASQPIELQQEIQDVKKYIKIPCTLQELEELDNLFINHGQSPGVVSNE